MASLASSSRATLGRASSSLTSQARHARRRHFASSSQAQERQISITFANSVATFQLPSLSSFIDALLPASVSQQPALAGIASDLIEDGNGGAQDALEWNGILNAVPKSKVSHSRKAMRAANKGLKDRVDFVHCASCGQPKLAHHLCASCFSVINRAHKAIKKDALRVEMKAQKRAALEAARMTEVSEDSDSITFTSKPKDSNVL